MHWKHKCECCPADLIKMVLYGGKKLVHCLLSPPFTLNLDDCDPGRKFKQWNCNLSFSVWQDQLSSSHHIYVLIDVDICSAEHT